MNPSRNLRHSFLTVLTLAAAGAVSAFASAQPADAADPGKDEVRPLLLVEHTGLGSFLVDPKDADFKKAAAMIPARLRELGDQIPDADPRGIELVIQALHVVSRPARIGMTYSPVASGGAFGYGLVLSIDAGTEVEARSLDRTVSSLLEQAGEQIQPKPSESIKTMRDVNMPFGRVSFGPRQSNTGWRYELIVGTVDDPDAMFASMPLPREGGPSQIIRGMLDLRALTPAMETAQRMAGGENPQIGPIIQQLKEAGLAGEDALRVTFEAGHTATHTTSRALIQGAPAKAQKARATGTVSGADLAMIPSDAVLAMVTKTDLSAIGDMLDKASEQGAPVDDMLAQFTQETGVNLRTEVLDTLGGTIGCYLSDSTGGSALTSTVLFISLKDRATFLNAHEKLLAYANEKLAQAPLPVGGVKVAAWKDGDLQLMSLRFLGLPIPVEITYAPTEKFLFLGFTPQAVIAATRQAAGRGDKGLAANPRFAAMFDGKTDCVSVGFSDVPRLAVDGYPWVTLIGSALANGVRSETDSAREPGMVVPVFADLMKDARAGIRTHRFEGETLIVESRGDRSLLVSVCGLVGVLTKFAPVIAAIGAAAGDKLSHADPDSTHVLPRRLTDRSMPVDALVVLDAWLHGDPSGELIRVLR